MNVSSTQRWPTVVAGFGSPHGDDQAGWRLASMLQQKRSIPVRVVAVHEVTQLLEALVDCQWLIVIDACRTGAQTGSITRLRWPDARIVDYHHHSTHGLGICGALQLAARLEKLPSRIDVFGVEAGACLPGEDISPAVLEALVCVESKILNELREVIHA